MTSASLPGACQVKFDVLVGWKRRARHWHTVTKVKANMTTITRARKMVHGGRDNWPDVSHCDGWRAVPRIVHGFRRGRVVKSDDSEREMPFKRGKFPHCRLRAIDTLTAS